MNRACKGGALLAIVAAAASLPAQVAPRPPTRAGSLPVPARIGVWVRQPERLPAGHAYRRPDPAGVPQRFVLYHYTRPDGMAQVSADSSLTIWRRGMDRVFAVRQRRQTLVEYHVLIGTALGVPVGGTRQRARRLAYVHGRPGARVVTFEQVVVNAATVLRTRVEVPERRCDADALARLAAEVAAAVIRR